MTNYTLLAQSILENNTSSTTASAQSASFSWIIIIFIIVAIVLIGIGVIVFILIARDIKEKNGEKKSKSLVSIEVRVPQNNEVEVKDMEQVFASIYGLSKPKGIKKFFKSPESISFEVVAFPEAIMFYVMVPRKYRSLIEKQIHATYPTADINPVNEYNIFQEEGRVAFASLEQNSDEYKPLNTYEELSVDLLSSITTSLSKLEPTEGVAVQILVSSSGNNWRKKGKSYISNLKKKASDSESKTIVPEDIVSAIDKKCSKVGFATDIRIVTVARSQPKADRLLMNMISGFDPLKNQQGNSLSRKALKKREKKRFAKKFIYRIPDQTNIFNTQELATIYHFPNKNIQTPHIHWLLSKRAPASQEVSSKGLWLGKSIYRGVSRDVAILNEDRRRHMYIVGKTGTGKSYTLQTMAWQDIKNGKGIAFLDPHGDGAEWLLERIPPERSEDVIYFNPGDVERPLGFNVIDFYNEQEKHRIVNSFIGMMYKMFDPNRQGIVGPRFERAVRNAMLTAMSERGNTLIEVMRLLTDPKFVKEKLPLVKDEIVRRYWTDEIAQTSDFHKSEVLGYIVSKFDRFVTNKLMRNIIGQSSSTLNFRKIMDTGKILIVNLSKGLIGEENSQFLGLLIVPKILAAAMSRTDIPEEQRRDFYLYVDEFQNFATDDFAQILSEARKYRLNLIVANQYISQIDEKIREAVFGNVGTIMSFKVGVSDAQYLQNEFAPVFDQIDLVNLEAINAYLKLLVNEECPPPFSMYTHINQAPFDFPKPDLQVAETIRELSRLKYGKDVGIVETEIIQRAQLGGGDEKNKPPAGGNIFGGAGGMGNFPGHPFRKILSSRELNKFI